MTLPKKGLKTRPYNIDMNKENHIVTLPKKGLKTGPYNIDMNKEDHIVTLPKNGLKTGPYNIDMEKMEKKDLKKLTKGQLIKLLLNKVSNHDNGPFKNEVAQRIKPTPPPRTGKWENVKPKPVPRKSVKQMVKEYEDIIQPPEQFRDGYKPIPKPRTDRPLQMRRPPKPTRAPPPPNDGFNFDYDIFHTENTSLGKFKIISVQSRENKKFKSYTNEFKVKILKKIGRC